MSASDRVLITRRHLLGGLASTAAGAALAGCGFLAPANPTGPDAPTASPAPGVTPRPSATPVPPTPLPAADEYVAVAPKVLRSGREAAISVSLQRGSQPARGAVEVRLLRGAAEIARAKGDVAGRGQLSLAIPAGTSEGDYQIEVASGAFRQAAPVRVEDDTLLFVETDKPIYKPGQTIHVRVLTLDSRLVPVASATVVEIADAKGIKIARRDLKTDDFGMATFDVPLSTEPNLGVWKLTARAGKRTAQRDVRVERYVLPKYEVTVTLPKEWALASEEIAGTVAAEYSYGKPVKGEVVVRALRYVGRWEEYANVSSPLDGSAPFRLPAVQYASGVPGSGGLGNVSLEVTVRERSTGYEEKTTRLVGIAATPLVLQAIPESLTFKPGLPLNVLVLATSPDKKPLDAQVTLNFSYTKPDYKQTQETKQVTVTGGKALVKLTPPADAISLNAFATAKGKGNEAAQTTITLSAGYSPSGAFVQVEQTAAQSLRIGDRARFHVSATRGSGTFYYEVVARGEVAFSDVASSADIEVALTPAMAPRARLLVYQVQPNGEVAADYLPFDVAGDLPQKVGVSLSSAEVKPGADVEVAVQAAGESRVGLAAVDRSVFILAENRLNLQQVFAELERLYQQPQIELHSLGRDLGSQPLDGGEMVEPMVDVAPLAPAPVGGKPAVAPVAPVRGGVAPLPGIVGPLGSGKLATRGAKDVFADAGVVVLTSRTVPAGKEYESPAKRDGLFAGAVPEAAGEMRKAVAPAAAPQAATAAADTAQSNGAGLAEVQRVRQFFPETWLWETLATGADGKTAKRVTAPDSITTWMFRAVALSKTAGLGVGEAQLKVLQPFFVSVDLPYAAIRGEELPVRIALYNYEAQAADFTVEIERGEWFELLDGANSTRVHVGPSDVGAASFKIRPGKLGVGKLKVTARSAQSADAIVKELIVEPEGVAREVVENLVLTAPTSRKLDLAFPSGIVSESGRALIALTGSYLTQSIAGLEGLLKMPFGCGEQNMINFAPNVFVTRYLKETNQTKPEVLAKSELMMTTGYQRELTYRRRDGSFSAFGDSDKDGSLWLTAFVLKTFAQAKGLIFVDDAVLASASAWIAKGQKSDGSFDPVGFVHHQELLGGLAGKQALTAYVAVALREAGETAAADRAIRYLEGALDDKSGTYASALGAYALALAKSPRAADAIDRLLKQGKESEAGLSWGGGTGAVEPQATPAPGIRPLPRPGPGQSAAVETTGYAILALLAQGDRLTASRAARWLVGQRNAYGGFGSTQDTVVGLQALATFSASTRSDVDATVTLRAGAWRKDVKVDPTSADVLQSIELPTDLGGSLDVEVAGKGQVVLQTVRRFSVPAADEARRSVFDVKVDYGTASVAVDDLITISTTLRYTPPEPIAAGMVVIDVAMPTGFAPEADTLDKLVGANAGNGGARIKRYDIAGRKVSIYVEDMKPNEEARFAFKARALYPVRAQAVTTTAYSYYRPADRGESLGGAVVVAGR